MLSGMKRCPQSGPTWERAGASTCWQCPQVILLGQLYIEFEHLAVERHEVPGYQHVGEGRGEYDVERAGFQACKDIPRAHLCSPRSAPLSSTSPKSDVLGPRCSFHATRVSHGLQTGLLRCSADPTWPVCGALPHGGPLLPSG